MIQSKAIYARLDREIEKKNTYKEENMKLKEYIAGMRREDPTFVSPIAVDCGFHFDHEAARNPHAEFGKWIEDVTKQADDFLTLFVQAFDKSPMLAFKIQYLEGIWDEFQLIQEKTIPRLKVLKRIPMPTLIHEGVLHEGDIYDFQGWYCLLAMRRST